MKLLAFTLGMIVIPIGSYYVTVDTLFKGIYGVELSSPVNHFNLLAKHDGPSYGRTNFRLKITNFMLGNSTYAGALAAIMANVVLIGYIFAAMAEDQSEQQGGQGVAKEGKKDR